MKVMVSRFLLRNFHLLQSWHAIALGWASELQVLVQVNHLPEHYRLKSDDPDFWVVWSGQDSDGETVEREVDWKAVADDWQQVNTSIEEHDSEKGDE
ncbi:hypothetical protein RVM27_09960 [Halomonas sp. KM007]